MITCTNPPSTDHAHCPLHGCVQYVCCQPSGDLLDRVFGGDVAAMNAALAAEEDAAADFYYS